MYHERFQYLASISHCIISPIRSGGPSFYLTVASMQVRDIATPVTTFEPTCGTMADSKLKAAILVVSETASQDPSTDKCIPTLRDVFAGVDQWEIASTEIVPDSVLDIQKSIRSWTDGESPVNLIVTSGGTGFATKDVTPEVRRLLEKWGQLC